MATATNAEAEGGDCGSDALDPWGGGEFAQCLDCGAALWRPGLGGTGLHLGDILCRGPIVGEGPTGAGVDCAVARPDGGSPRMRGDPVRPVPSAAPRRC